MTCTGHLAALRAEHCVALAQEPADWKGDMSAGVMICKRGTPERVKTLCWMAKFLP